MVPPRQLPGRRSVLIASICLVLGTAGGAVADSLITGAQIKDGSVTGKDVRNGSLTTRDLADAASAKLRGPRGAEGPAGPAGSAGPAGAPGYQIAEGDPRTVPARSALNVAVACPTGTTVLGGGALDAEGNFVEVASGGPMDVGTWEVTLSNPTDAPLTWTPYAVCTGS